MITGLDAIKKAQLEAYLIAAKRAANLMRLRFREGTPSRRKHPYNAKPGEGHVYLSEYSSFRKLRRAAKRGKWTPNEPDENCLRRYGLWEPKSQPATIKH